MGQTRTRLGRLGTLVGLFAAAAGSLFVLGQLPLVLAGPQATRRFNNVEELERSLGERLALPSYFPNSLRWPPVLLERRGQSPASVLLVFSARQEDSARVYLAQTVGGRGRLEKELLPPAVSLEERELELHGRKALLLRLKGEDGSLWYELRLEQDGRSVALRSKGALEELLRMVSSLHREGP